jgi:putative transposase
MSDRMQPELTGRALFRATQQQRPAAGTVHHSDRGSQDISIAFGQRCEELGVRLSMGSVGEAYDNAMAESFLASLECEVLDRSRFRTREETRMAVITGIEGGTTRTVVTRPWGISRLSSSNTKSLQDSSQGVQSF